IRVLPPPPSAPAERRERRSPRKAEPIGREPPANMDAGLFERLRAERLAIAKEKGAPAYVVCHDRTLMEIAAEKPRDRGELARVAGMGPARIEAYGERLLAVVHAHA